MEEVVKRLIDTKDFRGLKDLLRLRPELADKGLFLGASDSRKAHPLHRVCDGVLPAHIRKLKVWKSHVSSVSKVLRKYIKTSGSKSYTIRLTFRDERA